MMRGQGGWWVGLTDDDGDAIVGDEGDGVWALISHGDGVVVVSGFG